MSRTSARAMCAALALSLAVTVVSVGLVAPVVQAAVDPVWVEQAPPECSGYLAYGVSALDANHVWAAGGVNIMNAIWFYNGSSWKPQLSQPSAFRGIHAVDATHVYAVNDAGKVWRYNGLAWEELATLDAPVPLRAVRFYDADHGFVAGDDGMIYYTNSGGASWDDCAIPAVTTDYYTIALDKTSPTGYIAWVSGANGEVKKQVFNPAVGPTTTWEQYATGGAGTINGIDFIGPTVGWAVDTNGTIYGTGDGAATWVPQHDSANQLNAVDGVDATHVWAAGNAGEILFFNGTSWTAQASGVTKNLFCVLALNSSHIWAGGGNFPAVMRFSNGSTWTGQTLPSPMNISSVDALSTARAWACTSQWGNAYTSDGTAWSDMSLNAASGAARGISGVAADDVWKVNDMGVNAIIQHWGGSMWETRIAGAYGQDYFGVFALDADNIWIVGNAGVVNKWNPGTSMWDSVPMPGITPFGRLRSVFALPDGNVWIVGEQGQIYHYVPGGPTPGWKDESVPGMTAELFSVYAVDANNVFAVGAGGTVMHYTSNWQTSSITGIELDSVSGADASHVWACGQNGEIWRFNGTSWSQEPSGTTRNLSGISAVDQAHVWAVGDTGTILYREWPTPTVSGITPNTGVNSASLNITNLAGTNFRSGATVKLRKTGQADIAATNVNVASGTRITCTVNLNGKAAGAWDVVVTNNDGKSATRAGAFTITEAPSAQSTWYLAEGSSAWGFDTHIAIENPNNQAVHCDLTYMLAGGATNTDTVTMPANSRATVYPFETLGQEDFSTKVTCREGKPICADRTMMWRMPESSAPEAHSSVGVSAPAKKWYLPEGSTAWGFECWLLIQNPNAQTAHCTVTYMTETKGAIPVLKEVPPNSRATFNIADDVGQVDTSIQVDSDIAVIPERAMYRNDRREGHDSIGTTTPAESFYLAEGTTAWGFTTYVLVQNPGNASNNVTLTYMTEEGPVAQEPFTMEPYSRRTVRVNDVLPDKDFSTSVEGTRPLIAERSMYWDNGTGEACHDSIGMAAPHKTFYLPDGQVSADAETFTLVQNPNATDVTVEVSYLLSEGTPVTFTDTVAANSRRTFNMADSGIKDDTAGIVVRSMTNGKKIMCERAMYYYERAGGTDTIGGFAD